jgi:hypothetical protein
MPLVDSRCKWFGAVTERLPFLFSAYAQAMLFVRSSDVVRKILRKAESSASLRCLLLFIFSQLVLSRR